MVVVVTEWCVPHSPTDEIGIAAVEEREFILSKIYELKNPVLAASDDELTGKHREGSLPQFSYCRL